MLKPLAYLLLTGSPQATSVCPVTERRLVLSRDRTCSLRLVHPTISRRHCEVWGESDKLFAHDLDSVNGTYVNGDRIKQKRLSFGDLIQVGPFVLQVVRSLMANDSIFQVGHDVADDTVGNLGHRQTVAVTNVSHIEHEIVRLLAEGAVEKEVAQRLNVTRHSVHSHLKQLYHRLGISSRAELLAWYWRGKAK